MSAAMMKELRLKAGLTQAEMADLMGLGKTAYVDLEAGDPTWKRFKARHLLALERVSLKLAVDRGDINQALPSVRRDALALAALITDPAPYQVVARYSHGFAQAGCPTATEALRMGRVFLDDSAASVVITYDGRPFSLDQLRGEIDHGRLD